MLPHSCAFVKPCFVRLDQFAALGSGRAKNACDTGASAIYLAGAVAILEPNAIQDYFQWFSLTLT